MTQRMTTLSNASAALLESIQFGISDKSKHFCGLHPDPDGEANEYRRE
jgi:hypothetical protein